MTFQTLALIGLIGLVGPVLAVPVRWQVPVIVGELAAGVLFGVSGFGVLHPHEPTFSFLAEVGFALVMFVAGTHVPVRDARLRGALGRGVARVVLVAAVAIGLAIAVAAWFGTGHAALYAVLMASSSAALVLPVVDSLGLTGPAVLQLLPQVAIADAACIVALPLVIDPSHAGRAALGALAVLAAAAVVYLLLSQLDGRGVRKRVHVFSERRRFAVELRVNLVLLFGLAAIAVATHVSILLAGFAFGLAVAALGEPHRLAKQLFAVTEGFFGPLFFVWLGASLNLRDLGTHPSFIGLGVALGVGAALAHGVAGATRMPAPLALLASAQLGVPVAAATVGSQLHVLRPGEPAALILGALVTIALSTVSGVIAARRQPGDDHA